MNVQRPRPVNLSPNVEAQRRTARRRHISNGLALSCISVAASMVCQAAMAQAEAALPAPAAASAPSAAASAGTMLAQASTDSTSSNSNSNATQDMGKVTVTARRRAEALVDVPLAISVVTAQKLEQLGIKSTTDLANYVPGLEFNNYTAGNNRNDRGSGRALVFRGLSVSTVGGAGGSMFLNGAAVLGNEVPSSLDIGQVEILRGPQSVYFGRATMTGAVSYRTRNIPDTLSGEVEVEAAQRNTKNIAATIAGPLVPGLLKGRLTALTDQSGGYVTNDYNNGASKLGATSRKSLSTTLELTPMADLSFKGYFNVFSDDDGPSATAFIRASRDNCKLGTTQSTFCGEIPGREFSSNYINTNLPQNFADKLFTTPLIANAGFDRKVGQQRKASNSDIVANWDLNDYLHFQSITGYHTNVTLQATDGIGQPVQPTFPYSNYFYTFTQKFNDFSQEVRLSSNAEERLSWTVGANYISTKIYTHAIVGFQDQPAGTSRFPNQNLGDQISKTTGVFGGLYYKLTPKLTLSGEAREQKDEREAISTNLLTGVVASDLMKTFRSFSPRVSADYDIGGRRKVYASYAQGNRPGGFNTTIAAQAGNPTALQQIADLLGGGGTTYAEEKLKIAEVGFKGELDGGQGFFDINAYMGTLSNQQITIGALIPVLGFSVTGTANAGESKIHGIEFQGNYNFTREFSLGTTFAWNYTKRNKFLNTSGLPQFGTTDFSGKTFANVPEFSGSVVASYTHPVGDNWNFFSNLAGTYRGKTYVDAYNAAYIKSRVQMDLHAGVSNDRYTIEGYVKNLFNDQNYTGGSVAPDFGTVSYNAFFGGWAPPRQIGTRLRVKF